VDDADAAGKDIGKRVTAAGYGHRRVAEIVLIGDGDLSARLARLQDSDPETFADVVAPEYQDLGFGRAEGNSGTVRTLVFGLSLSGEFTGRAAALGDLRAVRAEMLSRVNGARAAKRLPPLLENPSLDAAAQNHAPTTRTTAPTARPSWSASGASAIPPRPSARTSARGRPPSPRSSTAG
jgi:uncharacterized protein YkwD